MGRKKARKKNRSHSVVPSEQAIEVYMSAVQEAVLVSNQIERLQADTVMAIVDQLTPYSNGGLAVYGGFIDRERLSCISAEYGTGYARFVLLTALFFAHACGGFLAQVRAIHDIAGSPHCPGEPFLKTEHELHMLSRVPRTVLGTLVPRVRSASGAIGSCPWSG
ncbi:hypothetical protein, partial [Streptomyces sp. KR55]|uniref:hypothetical protein n=1 Tax=Streptomyces sp. KR55 TaxID=3457425 RepID=UPI003FD43253